MANKVLHIMPMEKFTADYIEKINSLFDPEYHRFYVYGQKHSGLIRGVDAANVHLLSNGFRRRDALMLKGMVGASDRVVLHSLFVPTRMLLLFSMMLPEVHDKFVWCIWGGDLYDAWRARGAGPKAAAREVLRRKIISKLRAVVAIPGDFEYLKQRYGVHAVRLGATYAYDFSRIPEPDGGSGAVTILVGNSASPSCRHVEAIEMLAPYRGLDIQVVCPLSYSGSGEYVQAVAGFGAEVFGEKFIPLADFMEFGEYMGVLANVDIAVFNHDRQQAFGSITELLYSGKRVYVSPLNPVGDFYRDLGAIVYSTGDLSARDVRKQGDGALRSANRPIIESYFSDEAFAARWAVVFDGDWRARP